jgi:uncharacterized RDD family membrane protein YckC
MKINEGPIDRIVRVALGVALLALGIFFIKGTLGIVLDVVGAIALITGVTGFCLLYRLFGDFSTLKKN